MTLKLSQIRCNLSFTISFLPFKINFYYTKSNMWLPRLTKTSSQPHSYVMYGQLQNVVQMRFLVLVLWNKWCKYYHPFNLTNNLSSCSQCMCEQLSKSFHHVKFLYSSNHKLFMYRHYIEHFWKLMFSMTDSLETKINSCIYIYICYHT
jgi:hypothetical protein